MWVLGSGLRNPDPQTSSLVRKKQKIISCLNALVYGSGMGMAAICGGMKLGWGQDLVGTVWDGFQVHGDGWVWG